MQCDILELDVIYFNENDRIAKCLFFLDLYALNNVLYINSFYIKGFKNLHVFYLLLQCEIQFNIIYNIQ